MSESNKFTQSFKKEIFYADFFTDLSPHPESNDLVRNINEMAIKRALKNLFATRPQERWFNPSFGANLEKFLFDPIDNVTTEKIRNAISESIEKFEPRIKLLSVIVTPNENNNRYDVTLRYLMLNQSIPITTELSLKRVR